MASTPSAKLSSRKTNHSSIRNTPTADRLVASFILLNITFIEYYTRALELHVLGIICIAIGNDGDISYNEKEGKALVSGQVGERVQLEQGGYILLPTTFEPGQESSFTLRVFSSKPLKLK